MVIEVEVGCIKYVTFHIYELLVIILHFMFSILHNICDRVVFVIFAHLYTKFFQKYTIFLYNLVCWILFTDLVKY